MEREPRYEREQWKGPEAEEAGNAGTAVQVLRRFFALVLLSLGIIAAVWTLHCVHTLVSNPKELPLYREISAEISKITITLDGKNVQVNPPSHFLAALAMVFVLFALTSLAGVLISQGVNLINLDMERLLRKLDSMKDKILTAFNRRG